MPNDQHDADRNELAKLLDWTDIKDYTGRRPGDPSNQRRLLPYFSDDTAAMQVVAAMVRRGHDVDIYSTPGRSGPSNERDGSIIWTVYIETWNGHTLAHAKGTGESPAPFVCRAAIDALNQEEERDDGN